MSRYGSFVLSFVLSLLLIFLVGCGGGGGGQEVACGSCHEIPPDTGAHMIHYYASTSDATYGGTGDTSDILPGGSAYAFDCGNCHPLDPSSHENGVYNSGGGMAEVDLSPLGAPPGSLKAMNATVANYAPGSTVSSDTDGITYTLGTCSEVYCHSYLEYSVPGPVPAPGVDFQFTAYPITYPAFTIITVRAYTTPAWGDTLSCGGCHGFSPRTSYPTVTAGAGDSHSWIDSYGWENLHGFSHNYEPIACATCHFSTVSQQGVRAYDVAGWSVYDPVPINDHGKHVNGLADVQFTTDIISFANSHDLSTAAYIATTRTCSNVSCHLIQTEVSWGTPYRSSSRRCSSPRFRC